jgi:hypothetical protein
VTQEVHQQRHSRQCASSGKKMIDFDLHCAAAAFAA